MQFPLRNPEFLRHLLVNTNGLLGITQALQKALQRVPSDFDMQNVALTFALKRDPSLRWAYVPIRFRARQGGTNSINLSKIARMGWQMLLQINTVGR